MADLIQLVVNTEQAKQYTESKRQSLIDMVATQIDAVNQMMADRVRDNLSGGVLRTQSGALLGTVMQEPAQVSGDVVQGAVTAGGPLAPYGIYFEEGGLGYYQILPVNARALAFEMHGNLTFAKAVNHPPIPHLPWFAPTIEQAQEDMVDYLNAGFAEVLST